MKITSKVLALTALLAGASQGATTISGTLCLSGFRNNAGTNVPAGSLVMLIADTDNNGFLDLSMSGLVGPAAITPSATALSGRTITPLQAGITPGTSFGGDTIVNTSLTTTVNGTIASILPGIDITAYTGHNFAIVWFSKTPVQLAVAGALANEYFGIISLADWTLPASDSGATFSLSATDASFGGSYYATSPSITAAQVGATGFFTGTGVADGSSGLRSAQFQIVPEPSAALLGALGALGLLRRRRI